MEPLKSPLSANWSQLEAHHKTGPGSCEYFRRKFIQIGQARQCVVSVYEIPPGKAAYPYHYHLQNEEVFFILSGTGTLRTPQGERFVSAGELLFFPAEPGGAHKLTNTGAENLIYADFDTQNPLDAAVYPDSRKIGLWGRDVNKVFLEEDAVDYYKDE